jgi:hypothetical protein
MSGDPFRAQEKLVHNDANLHAATGRRRAFQLTVLPKNQEL